MFCKIYFVLSRWSLRALFIMNKERRDRALVKRPLWHVSCLFLFCGFYECTIRWMYGSLIVGSCYCVNCPEDLPLKSVFKKSAHAGVELKSGTNWSALHPLNIHPTLLAAHFQIVLHLLISSACSRILHPFFSFCCFLSKMYPTLLLPAFLLRFP